MKLHIWLLIVIQICSGFADYIHNPKSADGLCALYNNQVTIKLGMKDQSAVILQATINTGASYTPRGNCMIEIVPTKGYGIVFLVEYMSLRTDSSHRCKDYVQIKGTDKPDTFCSTSGAGGARFSSPETGNPTIVFHTEQDTETVSNEYNFRILLTQYRDCRYTKQKFNEFACSNSLCVWEGLACDGKNNCGAIPDSDEDFFTCVILHILYLVLYIGAGLAGLFIICVLVIVIRNRKDPVSSAPSTNYGSSEGRVVRRGFGYEEALIN